eukprot:TRINITY_DN2239_c0_g1_i1.p1 TRINITY_DN2239_c0_g1~~TRINITY_DN2239_c0_g1_i1.p1  ORF type:complete len:407 (-),score=62.93 TRINITY_DN2239_c0_g1_i1:268-1404(-)
MVRPCLLVAGLCVLLSTVTSAFGANFTRFYLNDINPQAICNDGSPATYYFRPGYGDGSKRWIVRLQGGGWCYDGPSCASRKKNTPYWMTSTVCPPSITDDPSTGPAGIGHAGILSSNQTENPHFYNSNHVWLWYCSSDSNLGTRPASNATFGYHFLGKHIINALLTHLKEKQQPSIMQAEEVLLTGDSAGGVSTFNNADYIGSMLSGVHGLKYRAFVDCGWFLDIPTYENKTNSFQYIARSLLNNWHVQYNDACVKYFGPENSWKCFHAQYAWSHVITPLFFQEYQYDSANLGMDGISIPFLDNADELSYALKFSSTMSQVTSSVPGLFFPNCIKHQSIDTAMFHNILLLYFRHLINFIITVISTFLLLLPTLLLLLP